MKHDLRHLVTALGFALAASAGQPAHAADTVAVAGGGELTIAATAGPANSSWNPLSAAGDVTNNRLQQWPLYPHAFLTRTDGAVVLNEALLTSAEVVGTDPMVVEYVIRDEAVWSDGTPITAADFEYTQKVQDPRACKECLPAFTAGYELIDKIEAGARGKSVRMTFSKAYAPWKTLFPYILPAHVGAGHGDMAQAFNDGFGRTVPTVSGGPYMVADYQDGVVMTLVKNPRWYGRPAHLDTIRFRYISTLGEQITALQNGEIDVANGTPTLDAVEQARAMDGMTVEVGPALGYFHFSFKAEGDLFGDPALRRAVVKAIDVPDMTQRTVGQYLEGFPPMTSATYIPGQKVGEAVVTQDNTAAEGVGRGDVEGALKMLADAGYVLTDGRLTKDGAPLREVRILSYAVDPVRMQLAELLQAQLAKLGMTAVIDGADRANYLKQAGAGAFDVFITGTTMDLGALSVAQYYGTGQSRNYFGYSSPEVDALVGTIATTLDEQEAARLTNELDRVLLRDAVVLPLFAVALVAVYPDRFANISVNPSKYGLTMNIEDWGLRK